MTIIFELDDHFLLDERIPLDTEDLAYGFDRGYIKPGDVIAMATHNIAGGATDPVLIELASLLSDDVGRIPDLLALLDDPERIHDPRESARKWLYLQLKAAYLRRGSLGDPLGVVEQIYADFEYPPTLKRFVRYMPARAGDDVGTHALMDRWQEYLESEWRLLTSGN